MSGGRNPDQLCALSAGLGPTPRSFTTPDSASNQNVAPNSVDNAVMIQPISRAVQAKPP